MNRDVVGEHDWPRESNGTQENGFVGLIAAEIVHASRWIVLGVAVVAFATYGLSFLLPSMYTATATFIPSQEKNNSLSSLSQLTGGLDLLQGSSTDSPVFYSRLVGSHDVLKKVVESEYEDGSLFEYYGFENSDSNVEVVIRKLRKSFSVSVDRIPGIVRVSVTMENPVLASDVASRILENVDQFNSSIHRTSARNKRVFLEEQLIDSSAQLKSAEDAIEKFLKQNRLIDSPFLTYQKTKLERRVQMSQELFLALSRQLQTARIEEVNTTPVISVIDEPFPPGRRSSPRPILMVFIAAFSSAMFGVVLVLIIRRRYWMPTLSEQG